MPGIAEGGAFFRWPCDDETAFHAAGTAEGAAYEIGGIPVPDGFAADSAVIQDFHVFYEITFFGKM